MDREDILCIYHIVFISLSVNEHLICFYISFLFGHLVMSNSVTPWTAARQASLSFTISWSLLKLMSIESVMPFNHLILCHPLPLLPSVFTSIRVFSDKSALCIRWPKHWSFSFSISPSNEYSGLISFRIDWFDILAVQGTLKSLLLDRDNMGNWSPSTWTIFPHWSEQEITSCSAEKIKGLDSEESFHNYSKRMRFLIEYTQCPKSTIIWLFCWKEKPK